MSTEAKKFARTRPQSLQSALPSIKPEQSSSKFLSTFRPALHSLHPGTDKYNCPVGPQTAQNSSAPAKKITKQVQLAHSVATKTEKSKGSKLKRGIHDVSQNKWDK